MCVVFARGAPPLCMHPAVAAKQLQVQLASEVIIPPASDNHGAPRPTDGGLCEQPHCAAPGGCAAQACSTARGAAVAGWRAVCAQLPQQQPGTAMIDDCPLLMR